MPLFLVATRKAVNTAGITYKWSNRYFFEETDIVGALNAGQGTWELGERTFHAEHAFCYEIYANQVGDPPFTPGTTRAVPIGIQRGSVVAGGAIGIDTVMPNFTVARVDYAVIASRPSRKFYRLPLMEGHVDRGQLTVAITGIIQSGANFIASLGNIRDVDGQSFTGSAVVFGVTSRRVGREAAVGVPSGPPYG
jgi:hypothetical protein